MIPKTKLNNHKLKIVFFLGWFLLIQSCGNAPTAEIHSGSGKHSFQIEIADTPTLRSRGLMYRHDLAASKGMLFIWERDVQSPFWMKNTYISLDIIFINKEGVIVDIAKNTTPKSEKMIYSSRPYVYTLEINAGLADRYQIRTGDKIIFSNIDKHSS